jgi:hypothetical protein
MHSTLPPSTMAQSSVAALSPTEIKRTLKRFSAFVLMSFRPLGMSLCLHELSGCTGGIGFIRVAGSIFLGELEGVAVVLAPVSSTFLFLDGEGGGESESVSGWGGPRFLGLGVTGGPLHMHHYKIRVEMAICLRWKG